MRCDCRIKSKTGKDGSLARQLLKHRLNKGYKNKMTITLKKDQAEGVLNAVKNAKHYTGEQRLLNTPVEYARDFVRINASFDQVTRELVACNINPYEMSKVIGEFMGLMATEINGLEGVRK